MIQTRERSSAVLSEPSELVTRKCLNRLDKHCGAFIARSPFMLIASADRNGNVDVSSKGDPPGFVKILDANTLAVPDRPGNHRADTMENILQNRKVGLILLIPGNPETLRVSGVASIVRDEVLMASMAIRGQCPKLAIVIEVEDAFFRCSKCKIRPKFWQPEHWPDLTGLPGMAETMVDAGKLELTENKMHRIVEDDERDRLYKLQRMAGAGARRVFPHRPLRLQQGASDRTVWRR